MVPYWIAIRIITLLLTINNSGFYLFEAHNIPDIVLNALYKVSAEGLLSPTCSGHWDLVIKSLGH